jgi:hypothetical protein
MNARVTARRGWLIATPGRLAALALGAVAAASASPLLPSEAQAQLASSEGPDIYMTEGSREDVPEEYVVREGDTLYDICDRFFDQPWVWPTIWALNPHVTNPHWIYPGDVLRLRLSDTPSAATPGVGPAAYAAGSAEASHWAQRNGFIAEEELEKKGTIEYSEDPQRWLGEDQPVYIRFEKLDEVRIGQKYSVFEKLNDVYHPITEDYVGQKIRYTGVVEVTRVDEHFATAEIIDSFREIGRGMHVVPAKAHRHLVSPRQNLIDLEGYIVDRRMPIDEMGQGHVVYLDRGSKDGVQEGNRFFVMRRGDGFIIDELDDEVRAKLPWEEIGELLVLETQERNSSALITRSRVEFAVGDKIKMQRHY